MTMSQNLENQDSPKDLSLDELLLDADNPRFGMREGCGREQKQILDKIVSTFVVDDVLSSLAVNGYFQSEPMVCQKAPGDKYVVKEGNRRLAACLILAGDERADGHEMLAEQFKEIWESHDKPVIEKIPVIIFPPGEDKRLLSYLGVRHISPTLTWDSYAKATWVAQVVKESKLDISEIAQMIGDQHKTINRLLDGYYFVRQMTGKGLFRAEDSSRKGRGSMSHYPFSWVYAILGYATVREFLGMKPDPGENPVPEDHLQDGKLVLDSMLGNKSEGINPAIRDSRQLGKLSHVFGDQEKISMLKGGKNVEQIGELTRPVEIQLADGLEVTKQKHRDLIVSLAENDLSRNAAGNLSESSAKNRKLAIRLDKEIQKCLRGDSEDE
ncbi:MAG: hypothetical protein OD918_00430 [Gammaproteobacteria bacterium]